MDRIDTGSVFGSIGSQTVVYGHIHRPYVRTLSTLTVANAGSVGLPYDGDRRASYLLLDESKPVIRRVAYDVDREIKALKGSGLPHVAWMVKMLETGSYVEFRREIEERLRPAAGTSRASP